MSDVVTVMSGGRILQQGAPREIYDEPANEFVATFIGSPNVIPGKVAAGSPSRVDTAIGAFHTRHVVPDWSDVAVVARSEDLDLVPITDGTPEGVNEFEGRITTQSFEGESVRHFVDVNGVSLESRSHRHSDVRVGDQVAVRIDPRNVRVVARR